MILEREGITEFTRLRADALQGQRANRWSGPAGASATGHDDNALGDCTLYAFCWVTPPVRDLDDGKLGVGSAGRR